MCTRILAAVDADEIEQRAGVRVWFRRQAFRASYNVGPGRQHPVVRADAPGGGRALQTMRWGILPPTSSGSRALVLNCRCETLGSSERPMFRDMRHTHRCVVPIQGYYEWLHQDRQARRAKHEAGGEAADAERDVASDTDNSGDADNSAASPGHSAARGLAEHAGGVSMSARPQPYAIRPTDGSALLFVAGLWRPFKRSPEEGEEGGDGVQDGEFVIVTCPAGKRLSWLHDRMPALLTTEEARSKWLDPAARWSDALAALLVPDDSQLEWFPVTTKMNKLSFDGPECIRRRTLSKPLDSYWPARSRTPSAAASSLAAAMSTGETKPAASPAKISPAKSSASPAQPSASPAKISPAKSSASPAQPSASPAKKHAREDGGKEHKSRAGKRRITDFFRTAQDQ